MGEHVIGVIGGGIVGLAIARRLSGRFAASRVVVFEKEALLATHQTTHNSGVVHAGIYYKPGSLKAELCGRGRLMLKEYCTDRDLPFDERGKLVVAVDADELGRFEALEATASRNGVPGLRRLSGSELRELEPHVSGLAALHSPVTAITDFGAIAASYATDVVSAGGEIRLSCAVRGIRQRSGKVELLLATGGTQMVDRLVVCAGLHADRVSRWADGDDGPQIVPFRGEYLGVRPGPMRDIVSRLIYPVPDPRYPFLGVHFTPRVTGELDIGPNAVLALKRESYQSRQSLSWRDVRQMSAWPGTWRMAGRHWRTGASELARSLSVRAYMRTAQRYVPDIGAHDVTRSLTGVRAQAVARDGSMVDDFCITTSERITAVRNAPSPAATSSLAIAEYVVQRMSKA